jgi:membrane protein required for colicin V production
MNRVDLALAVLLAAGALRGYWRGFTRELFAVVALVGGIGAAAQATPAAAALVQAHVAVPVGVANGTAFVGIFACVHTLVNLLGAAAGRLARTALARGINRVGGVLLGTGKVAAVLAFVLLFLHVFPLLPGLDASIMASTVGRPLMTAASDVVRLAVPTGNAAASETP